MKANTDDMIRLVNKVCYGSFKGLIEAEEGRVLQVSGRNSSDDGVDTTENIHVWDNLYVIERKN
jgi:hypothetical protein